MYLSVRKKKCIERYGQKHTFTCYPLPTPKLAIFVHFLHNMYIPICIYICVLSFFCRTLDRRTTVNTFMVYILLQTYIAVPPRSEQEGRLNPIAASHLAGRCCKLPSFSSPTPPHTTSSIPWQNLMHSPHGILSKSARAHACRIFRGKHDEHRGKKHVGNCFFL